MLIGLVTMGLAARGQAASRHRNSGNSDLFFYVFVCAWHVLCAKWLIYGTL